MSGGGGWRAAQIGCTAQKAKFKLRLKDKSILQREREQQQS